MHHDVYSRETVACHFCPGLFWYKHVPVSVERPLVRFIGQTENLFAFGA